MPAHWNVRAGVLAFLMSETECGFGLARLDQLR